MVVGNGILLSPQISMRKSQPTSPPHQYLQFRQYPPPSYAHGYPLGFRVHGSMDQVVECKDSNFVTCNMSISRSWHYALMVQNLIIVQMKLGPH